MTLPDKRIGPAGNEADSQHESRAHSQSTCPGPLQCAMDALELGHAQYAAGWEAGYAKGQQDASADLARAMLLEDARRWTEQAVTLAESRHGIGWAEEIRDQAEAVAG